MCICLGGALGTIQDKIFYATENHVKGYTKKGKQFFGFESNMIEPISSMYIYGIEMFLCGERKFSHFHDCVDANSYLCTDQINDVLCLPVVEGSWVGRGITPIIACDDKTVKVLEGSQLSYEVGLKDIPSVLHLFLNDGGLSKQKVLYGTKDGNIGLLELPPENGILIWEVPTKSSSAVTCINCYCLTGRSTPDIIIGKEDGLIEIYTVDQTDQITFYKSYASFSQCEECVASIQCGRVSSPDFDEIIVCSRTGWVFALTTEPIRRKSIDSMIALSPQIEVKVQELRSELEKLERKVYEERQKYHETISQDGIVPVTAPRFMIHDQYKFSKKTACFLLVIDSIIPIDYVLLQSKNASLATYRCQTSTTRIEIGIRSVEGQYGTLRAYICPKIYPRICQVRTYEIKPLMLHYRVHQFDSSLPLNVLKINGNFTLAEAHQWLRMLLLDIPDRSPTQNFVTFNFCSAFTGTQMQAIYSRGSAVFQSDNISTITIIRDVLSKEITKRQIKVDIQYKLEEESVAHVLLLLHPKLDQYINLTKKLKLYRGTKELLDNVQDLSNFTADMKELVESSEQIDREINSHNEEFGRIKNIIVNLYNDRERMCGRCGKNKIDELNDLLMNYDPKQLLQFFALEY